MGFVCAFFVGVIASLAAMALWHFVVERLPVFSGRKYSITGLWATGLMEASDGKGTTIELVKIKQTNERVILYIENYNSTRERILKLKGHGIYRETNLCAYYYFDDITNPNIGGFVLKSKSAQDGSAVLTGVYVQYIDREDVKKHIPHNQKYILRKIQLPLIAQMKVMLGKTYLADYNQALDLVNQNEVFMS